MGSRCVSSGKFIASLYESLGISANVVHLIDVRSAELSKYASNAFLAMKISFINQMARFAESVGADIDRVRSVVGADPRIGHDYLSPGCGYGGSCLPKDIRSLIHSGSQAGIDLNIIQAVHSANKIHTGELFQKISAHYVNLLDGKVFSLWGLSFKPGTDDMREAPSRILVESLCAAGAKIRAYDPMAETSSLQSLIENGHITIHESADDALVGADALIICTEWPEFSTPDFQYISQALSAPVIFDGRNMFRPTDFYHSGFTYISIGRMSVYGKDMPPELLNENSSINYTRHLFSETQCTEGDA